MSRRGNPSDTKSTEDIAEVSDKAGFEPVEDTPVKKRSRFNVKTESPASVFIKTEPNEVAKISQSSKQPTSAKQKTHSEIEIQKFVGVESADDSVDDEYLVAVAIKGDTWDFPKGAWTELVESDADSFKYSCLYTFYDPMLVDQAAEDARTGTPFARQRWESRKYIKQPCRLYWAISSDSVHNDHHNGEMESRCQKLRDIVTNVTETWTTGAVSHRPVRWTIAPPVQIPFAGAHDGWAAFEWLRFPVPPRTFYNEAKKNKYDNKNTSLSSSKTGMVAPGLNFCRSLCRNFAVLLKLHVFVLMYTLICLSCTQYS